jgi:hypothetical protein
MMMAMKKPLELRACRCAPGGAKLMAGALPAGA